MKRSGVGQLLRATVDELEGALKESRQLLASSQRPGVATF